MKSNLTNLRPGMSLCIVCDAKIDKRKVYDAHNVSLIAHFFQQIFKPDKRDTPFYGFVQICSKCRHGVMGSPPTVPQLEQYYEKQYWASRPTLTDQVNITRDAFRNDLRAHHQIGFILKHLTTDSIHEILEIGAGPAFASLLLREKFNSTLQLNVCEPGVTWNEYYKENTIHNISRYFPFDSEKKFDYIHTSHWLEHVIDLNNTVAKLKEVLREGGFIFVEVPNTEYQYWDLPLIDTPHIQFFTPRSLAKVFQKHGFECLRVDTYGQTFYQKYKGIPLRESDYGEVKKGCWIRSLFRKS